MLPPKAWRGNLARLQLALFGGFAISTFASIFASQTLLYLALLVLLLRLALRQASLVRTPLDAPILAFAVWTLLSASFSADPGASHAYSKKLLLLAVFFLATDTLAEPRGRASPTCARRRGGPRPPPWRSSRAQRTTCNARGSPAAGC